LLEYEIVRKKGRGILERIIQANDVIVGVAGNMKPSTSINEIWVPALKHVAGVRKPASQSMKSVSYKTRKKLARTGPQAK